MKRIMTLVVFAVICGGRSYAGGLDAPDWQTGNGNYISKAAAPATEALRQKAGKAIIAIKDKDFYALAQMVSPQLGLRFSPEAYLSKNNVIMSKNEVAGFFNDKENYKWTVDMAGNPVHLTPAKYYNRYIYNKDFINYEPVYNKIDGTGNLEEIYPGAFNVAFNYPGTPEMAPYDARTLRLVFLRMNGDIYLVAIVYNEPEI